MRHGILWWKWVYNRHPRISNPRSNRRVTPPQASRYPLWPLSSVCHLLIGPDQYTVYTWSCDQASYGQEYYCIFCGSNWNNHHRKWIVCWRPLDTRHGGPFRTSEAHRSGAQRISFPWSSSIDSVMMTRSSAYGFSNERNSWKRGSRNVMRTGLSPWTSSFACLAKRLAFWRPLSATILLGIPTSPIFFDCTVDSRITPPALFGGMWLSTVQSRNPIIRFFISNITMNLTDAAIEKVLKNKKWYIPFFFTIASYVFVRFLSMDQWEEGIKFETYSVVPWTIQMLRHRFAFVCHLVLSADPLMLCVFNKITVIGKDCQGVNTHTFRKHIWHLKYWTIYLSLLLIIWLFRISYIMQIVDWSILDGSLVLSKRANARLWCESCFLTPNIKDLNFSVMFII